MVLLIVNVDVDCDEMLTVSGAELTGLPPSDGVIVAVSVIDPLVAWAGSSLIVLLNATWPLAVIVFVPDDQPTGPGAT